MNKERLVGFIMVGLVIVIVIMYLSNRTTAQKLEDENEELKSQLEEEQTSTEVNNSSSSFNEAGTALETEDTQNTSQETASGDNSSDVLRSEIESYDTFVSEFADILTSYDDQEEKNEQLNDMTTESAQTYLKENYYILDDDQDISDVEDGEHAEGDFEPLEIDMDITSLDAYYTYSNNGVEVIAMYQTNTEAGDENFSGNYILKGTINEVDGDIKFDTITSIVSINDPNADELYD